MVHGSLTRSKRYSLFFTNRKWEKGIHCPLAGKGVMVSTALTGRERGYGLVRAHSASSISQSSGTSGSSLAGAGDVVGGAGDVVEDTAGGGVDGVRIS